MNQLIEMYLDRVLALAELPAGRAQDVRQELADHLYSDFEARTGKGEEAQAAALAAIKDMGSPRLVGSRLERPFRWVDVRSQGTARGVIAIGPRAIGVFAFGGVAFGVVAIGGLAAGLLTFSGIGLGLIAWGGVSFGLLTALGGFAIGPVAWGGLVVGVIGIGGLAYGLVCVSSGHSHAVYPQISDAPEWIQSMEWLIAIPKFIDEHLVALLSICVIIVIICSGVTLWFQRRWEKEFEQSWLFE